MKLQNMIRMQVVMAGVAAGLFLASAAPAQEITNTEWPDAPGGPGVDGFFNGHADAGGTGGLG